MLRLVVLFSICALISVSALPIDDPSELDERIVGGQDATIERYPYQVSLRSGGRHFCGGSIYKSNVIITAAHCVLGANAEQITVVAGTVSKTVGGVSQNVKRIVYYSGFTTATYDNDVAILLLADHFDFSDTIQPIGLIAANKELRSGLKSYVSGWGNLQQGGSSPDTLQYVAVAVLDTKKCAEAYKDYPLKIMDSMMCAGDERGGLDACQGDSGGPLVVENKLIGIVSWGSGCAKSDYPGVYASVAVLRNWIEEKVAEILQSV